MTRTLKCYYNIDRGAWCNTNGGLIPERLYPFVNLWETPRFVIGLVDSTDAITISPGATFSATLTDKKGNTIATPSEPNMAEVENGYESLSLIFSLATQEALDLLGENYREKLRLNLFLEYPSSGYVIDFSAPITLCNVFKEDAIPVPIGKESQYRVNPIDGGTDIWDYGLEQWMRGVLENGVLTYYPAP
jgi:hypothetical protein